jgi:hypothetical protein
MAWQVIPESRLWTAKLSVRGGERWQTPVVGWLVNVEDRRDPDDPDSAPKLEGYPVVVTVDHDLVCPALEDGLELDQIVDASGRGLLT